MKADPNQYDAIVIGLGAVGAATLYQLAKVGKRVLGIDRFSPPHSRGSSHGSTRITRQAIGEGQVYVPFAVRSHQLWREIEQASGRRLLFPIGCLIMADDDARTTLHGHNRFVERTITTAQNHGIPHEVLEASEVRRRFPQFLVPREALAYFEPGAGYLIPEECIAAQLTLSESLGATIVRDERVVEYKPTASDNGVVVRSERRVYYGEQVVLSVGAWVQDLLTHSSRYFTVTRQVLLWFSPEQRSHSFETPYFPAFVWAFGSGPVNGIYGFPALNGHAGGVKVSTSDYGPLVDPEKPRGAVTQEEISQVYENGIRDRIEGLSPRCVRSAVCVYTVTPNSDFVVQRHPGCERIVIASPCSGHGFKHSAALGEAIAQVIATGNSTLDLSPFRTTYLSVKSP